MSPLCEGWHQFLKKFGSLVKMLHKGLVWNMGSRLLAFVFICQDNICSVDIYQGIICTGDVSKGDIFLGDICQTNISLGNICSGNICTSQISPGKICPQNVCRDNICPDEICTGYFCYDISLDDIFQGDTCHDFCPKQNCFDWKLILDQKRCCIPKKVQIWKYLWT